MTENAATSSSLPPPSPDAKAPKKRRWRRRILWALGILLGIAVLLRVILIFALPPVLRSVAGRYGLTCEYERIELYLLSSDVGIWHLSLTPKEGGPRIAHAEYCRADVSPLRLLVGKLLVHRVEADELDLNVDRDAKGRIPLLERFLASSASTAPPPASTSAAPQELSLEPPIRIDSLRVHRVKTHFRDKSVTPNVETQFEVTVRVSDVGSQIRPARFLVDVTSPPLLDSLRIEGQGTSQAKSLDATMNLVMHGFHPKPAAGYLAAYGLRPVADEVSAQMSAQIRAQVVPSSTQPSSPDKPPPGIVKATLTLDKIQARADAKEAVALDRLMLVADQIDSSRASIVKLTLDGIRANAQRGPDRALCVAGFALDSNAAKASPPSPSPAHVASARTAPPFVWSIAQLDVTKLNAALRDEAINPATTVAVEFSKISAKNIVNDPARPGTTVSLDAQGTAPGIANTIQLKGTAQPFAEKKSADLTIQADGIRPDALRPYLAAMGLESQLKSGTFTAKIQGTAQAPAAGPMTADLSLDQIRFGDGQDLLAMNTVRISAVKIDPQANLIRVENIELAGPSLSARRESSGALAMLGLRTTPAAPAPPKPVVPISVEITPTSSPATKPANLPKIQIGKLTWKDIKLKLQDLAITPPANFDLSDVGVELSDITLDFAENSTGTPGKIHAWLNSPGLARSLEVAGSVTPAQGSVVLNLDVAGQGLDAASLAPYLKPTNIEPLLRDGSLKLHTDATITQKENQFGASVSVENLVFSDASGELIGVDKLKVENLVNSSGEMEIGSIEVNRPRANIVRDKEGALILAGARVPKNAQFGQSSKSESITVLKSVSLKDAQIHVRDEMVKPPADLSAIASASVQNCVVGKDAPPAQIALTAKVPGALDELSIKGTLSPAPKEQNAALDIVATGIRQGPLAPYLPPGTQITLSDGSFRMKIQTQSKLLDQGGQSASVTVSQLDYRDDQTQLLRLDTLKAVVSRNDLPKVLAIDEVSLTGLETDVRKTTDGNISALGVTLSKAEASTAKSGAATQPVVVERASTTAPTDIKQLVAEGRKAMPLITLEKLDLNVKRATLVNSSKLDSAPLTLADLRLRNLSRIEMLGDDPTSHPPIRLELSSRIDPLLDSLTLTTEAAPFANQATLKADLVISGIKGEGLIALAPELRKQFDGSKMTDGRFNAHLESEDIKIARRGPVQFDFSAPLDLSFAIKPVEFRAAPDGPVVAGVEDVHAEGVHVEPKTGAVHIHSLEITRPIGYVVRDDAGIHVLGLTVKPQQQDETAAPTTAPTTPAAVAATPPTEKPSAEMRIDKFLISGLDFRYEDRTTEPATLVPLSGLDVEARDLSNMAFYEDRPIRFSALLNAGKVPMQVRSARDKATSQPTVERELFSQITASGKLSLYPQPRGWVKTSVSGLELAALRGAAKSQGVDLDFGVFDSTLDARFAGDGSANTRSRFIFTDLRLSEPPDGPIFKLLHLPAPLDTVIVALEDPSGGITIPLPVDVKQGQIDKAQVTGAAVGALGSVIATAIASSPIKVGAGVAGLVGLGDKNKDRNKPAEPIVLGFSPAATALNADEAQKLDQVAADLRKNKKLEVTIRHELGGGDVARAAILANPSSDDCLSIATQLRQQKLDLLSVRSQLAGQARGELAVRTEKQAQATLDQLRELDRQIAQTEDALDRVYEMLKPGADRQADRRTRAAAIEIGQARLDAIKAALISGNIPNASQRVRAARAQFAPADGIDGTAQSDGGHVLLTVTRKK